MSFPRYPSYKDSGVEWLGEVPGHWDVTRLRHVTNIRKGKLPRETYPTQSASSDLPYLSMEFLRGDTETPHYVPESPSLLCAEDDDVLLLWDGSNAGEFLRAKRGVVSSTVAYLSGINIDRDFLFYACKAIQRGLQDQTIGMGIPHVSGDELRTRAIACPQIAEQTQIAAFLDRETAKIDALVAEQRRLMELLKEKRQAVISHAVTQGLNPHAPMKPSGIEWLGDVPAHWNYSALKYLATIKTGYAFSSDDFVGEGIPVLRIGDITTDGNIDFTDARCLPEDYGTEHAEVAVVRGDIVMAMTGATIGKTGWYDSERPALLNQRVCIFRSITPNEQRYIWHVLSAWFYAEHIALAAVGGAQPNISDSQLLQCVVPLPPRPEQVAIAAFLDTETAKFDTLTTEAQRAIDLLQERRTALISAAVTGQIDVRQLTKEQTA